MTRLGKFMTHGAVAALIGIAGLAVTAPAASAHVVCNRAGDCWSTHARYQYPNELGVRFYNDRYTNDRYRHRHWHDRRTWRDDHHESDRGYYRDGLWVTF